MRENILAALHTDDKILFGLIITALVAPTWMAWWNARIAKRQITISRHRSILDHDDLALKMDNIWERLDNHSGQIEIIKTNQEEMKVLLQDMKESA